MRPAGEPHGGMESADTEELLACYLALNAAEHHRAIVAAFTRAWLALDTTGAKQHRSA